MSQFRTVFHTEVGTSEEHHHPQKEMAWRDSEMSKKAYSVNTAFVLISIVFSLRWVWLELHYVTLH